MKDEDKTKEQIVNEVIELRRRTEELEKLETQHKQTDEALREAEARYRSIFENAVEGIFQTTIEGQILAANPALARMLGYSSVEELTDEIIDVQRLYIKPGRREEFICLMQAKENGIVTGFENQVRRKDGNNIWVSVNVRALRDSGGKLVGFEGMAVDITDRKRVERELLAEKVKFESIVKGIGAGLSLLDSEARIIWANEILQEWFGFIKKIRGMPCYELYDIKDPQKECAALRTLRSGRIERGESFAYIIGGEKRYFQLTTAPVKDEEGRIIQIVELTQDVTERKKLEEVIRSEYAFRRAIEDSILAGVAAVDLDGRQTYVNPAFCEMVGWSEEELLGAMPPFPYWPHEEVKTIKDALQKTISSRAPHGSFELRFRRRNEERFDVLVLLSPLKDGQGRTTGWLASVYDITERKRAEEKQRRAKELSDALNNINMAINSTLDFDEIMRRVVVDSAKALATEASWILLHESNYWVVRYFYGLPEEIVRMKFTEQEVSHMALAAQSKKPVAINDAHRDERISREVVERFDIKSVLIVPMIVREEMIGIIGFSSHSFSVTFAEVQIDFASKLAASVSLAIENARLYSELKRHDKTLETLYAIDRVVSQSLDLETIFRDALSKALEVTEIEGGGIYLLEEDGETLSLKYFHGVSPELAQAFSKVKVGQGVGGMAVKFGKPVTLDVEKYPRSEMISLLVKDGIFSLVSTPLLAKGKVVGAMTFINRKPRPFSQDDLDLIASIGSQIGVAVENTKLFSELERHHKMLVALYAIENVVSRSLDLEEIFNVALSKALEVTGTEAGTLYSLDGEVLRLEAVVGFSPEFKEKALIRKIGEGIPGIAAQLKKPVTMDISQFPSPLLLPYVTQEGLVSFIGTPLMSKGKVVGAMALGTKKKQVFVQADLDLLLSIGNAIGIAIENAQLYKESEENLQKLQRTYEELQTLDRMKDEFISNVSHELKTPLISIKGHGELLYDEKLDGLSDKQKKSLEAILRNADRLTRLINSILLITLLQAGKIEFHFEPLDLDEIVQICEGDFKSMMDKKQIIFKKDIPTVSKVKGDKDRFIEVICNLLDNAIKFTPQSGKVSIKAWDEAENVHLTVSDNGIGIPADIIPKLFTRFYQLDASTARRYGGTGLGLYITKNIIDAFGGKIWIESEVGTGTTVHTLLPIAKEEPDKV